jgi:LPXTG-motif cell wall-anchored protein
VLRRRALVALLAASLVTPSAAFAQGAGDDQYQDPFPEEQTQNGGGSAQEDGGGGLTDEPPVPAPAPAPEDPAPAQDPATTAAPAQLPNTGSEPLMLAYVGVLFVLVGAGLRLRTLDPESY